LNLPIERTPLPMFALSQKRTRSARGPLLPLKQTYELARRLETNHKCRCFYLEVNQGGGYEALAVHVGSLRCHRRGRKARRGPKLSVVRTIWQHGRHELWVYDSSAMPSHRDRYGRVL